MLTGSDIRPVHFIWVASVSSGVMMRPSNDQLDRPAIRLIGDGGDFDISLNAPLRGSLAKFFIESFLNTDSFDKRTHRKTYPDSHSDS